MSALTTLFALLLYFAAAVMIAGLAYKIFQYARTPAPLKIPTTPAPLSAAGAGLRVFGRVRALLTKNSFGIRDKPPVSNEIPWGILALPQAEC